MGDSWEDEADDFASGAVPPAASVLVAPKLTDRWDDEDVDDVPDAWDAEPEEKPAAASEEAKAKTADNAGDKSKSKKRSKQVAAAAEKKKQEAEEKRRQLEEAAAQAEGGADAADASGLSKEELRRLQEESDMMVAKDTFGVGDVDPQRSIDLLQPVTKEEFDKLQRLISVKLRQHETSPHYPLFVESLFRECTLELDCDSLRKLSTMFSALATEKQKLQKTVKGKKKGKGVVKVERDAASGALEEDFGYDDYDDFI